MSQKAHRPAPLPPAKIQPGYKSFEPFFNGDTNNNKAVSQDAFNRPTVIRPSDNQKVKKKPPPRPAPPKNVLIRKNAFKRTNSSARSTRATSSQISVVSPPPDLLADLHDIFGPPKQKSYPSPVSSRPAIKKGRAPQPQNWQKPSSECPLIDFDGPSSVIRQSNSTPSFRAGVGKTLLDEDLPNFFNSTSNSGSLQDLITIKTSTSREDAFDSVFYSGKKATARQHDPFGNSGFSNNAGPVTTRNDPFGSIFDNNIHAATAKTNLFGSVFHSDIKWDSPIKPANTSTDACSEEPWNIDQVVSPPEPQHPPPPPPPEACHSMEKWCKTLYDFVAQSPDELNFVAGDVIFVDEEISPDWWKGHLNGKTGVFPSNYVEVAENDHSPSAAFTDPKDTQSDISPSNSTISCYAKALYTFAAEQDGDLCFQEGDVIQVLYRINQDWLYGKFQNKDGQFPANFVKKLPVLQEDFENKTEVMARYSFKGEKEDELTFEEGDLIVVIENVNPDWSKGWVKKDQTCTIGHFPIAFTSACS